MHYLKTPLNDDLYNQILESSNSPDLIESLFEDKTSESISKNHVSCRALSLQEYNKYIINGTMNGAVTKNSGNVWHHFLTLNSTVRHSVGYGSTHCGTYYNICEILTDNQSNTYLRILGNTWTITVHNPYAPMTKTATYNNHEYWGKNEYYREHKIECFSYYIVITYTCFRPIFQILDNNNKSINIYH